MATDDLATLIRLAKLQLDEKRKVLAAIVAEEDRVKTQKTALLEKLETEKKASMQDFEAELSRGSFIGASLKKRDQFDAQLRQLAKLIEAAQDDMRQAFEEVKRYEIAKETRDRKAAKEAQKREGKELDEIGGDRHRRKEKTGRGKS